MLLSIIMLIMSLSANTSVSYAETVVSCPSGDKYVCYTKGDLEVRKGRGRTEVIIAP